MTPRTSKDLLDAYLDADYEFDTGSGSLTLRAGDESGEARKWLAVRAERYTFITAFNPFSIALCAEENNARHENLRRALDHRSWPVLPARGRDPQGRFDPEQGFMVLDAPLAELVELARDMEQNAVLHGTRSGAPRVIAVEPDFAANMSGPDQKARDGQSNELSVARLGFQRDDEWIFRNISFALEGAGCVLIEGRNGSGKTTLLRVLAGLLEKSAGEVTPELESIRYLGHRLALKEELTAEENILFINRLFNTVNVDTHALFETIGLTGYQDVLVRKLSAGQRKRLSLAPLVDDSSQYWLLDEPYANLDAEGAQLVHRLISNHLSRGGIALITSHGDVEPQLKPLQRISLNG